jgi:hypothetical protein
MVAVRAAAAPPWGDDVKFNLKNRVRLMQLGRDQALRPVYEAVANAFDAIKDRSADGSLATGTGTGTVRVVRGKPESDLFKEDGKTPGAIAGFEVEDDGVGFTDENYEAFNEAYSARKADTGGIGAGRLLWLKAFNSAEVDSTYREASGGLSRRRFKFDVEHGVYSPDNGKPPPGLSCGTLVRLVDLKPEFKSPVAAETIARHLIEHALEELLVTERIGFFLEDAAEGRLDLRELFHRNFQHDSQKVSLTVAGKKFEVRHFLVWAVGGISAHKLNYCARNRCVTHENLAKYIADLKAPIQTSRGQAYYLGTVAGHYLDVSVNDTRTALSLPDEANLIDDPTREQIADAVAGKIREYLKDHLDAIRKHKGERVRKVVSESAPELRTVVDRHPEILDRIAADAPERDILATISGQRIADRDEYKRLEAELLKAAKAGERLEAQKKALIERFASETNSQAIIALAEFACHRRAVLNVLNELLGTDEESGKSYKEEAVHQIIFPLRKTSDEVPPDLAHLWVLDERLAFHHYLASDKRLDRLDPVQVESGKEPDVLIFHHAFATSESRDNSDAITIIEFKRPGREQYTFDENPYRQVVGTLPGQEDPTAATSSSSLAVKGE